MFFSGRMDFQHDILLGPLLGHFLVHFDKLVPQFYILSSLVNSILQGESGMESASQPASQAGCFPYNNILCSFTKLLKWESFFCNSLIRLQF